MPAAVRGRDPRRQDHQAMRGHRFALIVTALWTIGPAGSQGLFDHGVQGRIAPPQPESADLQPRALLDKYCVTCHNQRMKVGGLALDTLNVSEVDANVDVLEKVVRKLRTGAMPPAGRPRPDKAIVQRVASSLEANLDRASLEHPNPGRPTLHRLNRVEYRNAIR